MNKLKTLDAVWSAQLALPQGNQKWRWAAKIAHLGDGTLVFGGLALVYWRGWQFNRPSLQNAVFAVLLSIIAVALVVIIIKYTLRRERPRDPSGFVTIQYDKYSFPSGHSARMASLAVAVLFFNPPLGIALSVAAVMIAAARVLVGVHYLSDVLVGLLLGAVMAVLVNAGLEMFY
ncbi:MAG TPA: phosphatase PAP2 family protein [Chloroflexi bacterium]|nr:phosphatase PAP2 family protein [Chloroflexota bacterium]